MDKLISILTICQKAGKLSCGFDAAIKSVKSKEAKLLLQSNTLSAKTVKELTFKAEGLVPVRTINQSMEHMEFYLGKRTGIIAVNDRGFADKINTILDMNE